MLLLLFSLLILVVILYFGFYSSGITEKVRNVLDDSNTFKKYLIITEKVLIGLGALLQILFLVLGWHDFWNPHGGFILLMFIGFIGIALFLVELVITVIKPNKLRVKQLLFVFCFPILLILIGINFGER